MGLYWIFFFFLIVNYMCLCLHFTLLKETLHSQKYNFRNTQNYFDSCFLPVHYSISFSKYHDDSFMLLSLSKLGMQNKSIWRTHCNVGIISYIPYFCKWQEPLVKDLFVSFCVRCDLPTEMTSSLSHLVWSSSANVFPESVSQVPVLHFLVQSWYTVVFILMLEYLFKSIDCAFLIFLRTMVNNGPWQEIMKFS